MPPSASAAFGMKAQHCLQMSPRPCKVCRYNCIARFPTLSFTGLHGSQVLNEFRMEQSSSSSLLGMAEIPNTCYFLKTHSIRSCKPTLMEYSRLLICL